MAKKVRAAVARKGFTNKTKITTKPSAETQRIWVADYPKLIEIIDDLRKQLTERDQRIIALAAAEVRLREEMHRTLKRGLENFARSVTEHMNQRINGPWFSVG